MDAAAILHVTTRFASLKHQGALTDDQFVLVNGEAKKGLVTDQVLKNISQAWKLPCDSSVDKAEYEEHLLMIPIKMQVIRNGYGTTESKEDAK